MKTKIGILLLAVSLLCVTGCATHSPYSSTRPSAVAVNTNGIVQVFGHDIDPDKTGNALQLLAQSGGAAALRYDSNSRAYLTAVDAVLTTAIQAGDFDPVSLNSALSKISIKEARDPNVTSGVEGALALYSMFYGSVGAAKIADASPYLVPALLGLRDGFRAALLAVPEPPPKVKSDSVPPFLNPAP